MLTASSECFTEVVFHQAGHLMELPSPLPSQTHFGNAGGTFVRLSHSLLCSTQQIQNEILKPTLALLVGPAPVHFTQRGMFFYAPLCAGLGLAAIIRHLLSAYVWKVFCCVSIQPSLKPQ